VVVEKLHKKITNGSVIYVGLSSPEKLEEKTQKKVDASGDGYTSICLMLVLGYPRK
jgi:hypothetical protein